MRRRSFAVQAFVVLVLCGVVTVGVRYYARRDIRLGHADTVWRLTYSIECQAEQVRAKVRVAVPADTPHCRVFRQDFRQDNLRLGPDRRLRRKAEKWSRWPNESGRASRRYGSISV